MKAAFAVTASLSHTCPWQNPGLLTRLSPLSATSPLSSLSPLSCLSVLGYCLFPEPSSQVHAASRSQGKGTAKWEEAAEFFVFCCGRKQGYFWPFSVQIRFFFFFLSQSPVSSRLQAGEGKSELRSEGLCIFAGCQFCLPPPAWLPPVSPDC